MRRLAFVALTFACATTPGPPDAGAGPSSSRGTGGIPCTATGSVSVDGTSYPFCLASVGDVQLKLVVPADTTGPLRLALYLHGDGAGPHDSGLALRKHAPFTTAHRTLYASVRAPNRCAWWLKPSYTTCGGTTPVPEAAKDVEGENAAALVQVIEALRAAFDVLDAPILFGGSSGGAIFLSSSFVPSYGARFPGVHAWSCGGDAPWSGRLDWDARDPATRTATKFFFTYGDKDFLVPDITRAIGFYRDAGLALDTQVVAEDAAPASSHCGNVDGTYSYDQLGRVAEVWADAIAD